jgi:hypothetical protein
MNRRKLIWSFWRNGMSISTRNGWTLSLLAIVWMLLPIVAIAQTDAPATTPNGRRQVLKPHTPPSPPPQSTLRPQIEILSLPAEKLVRPYSGRHIDVTTYHYDNARSGSNPIEVDLTPSTVKSPHFSLLKTLIVDGNVFAQPLLVSNLRMPDGSDRDILIIATGHNTIYAFDANTYSILWQRTLGPAQQSDHIGCPDVKTEYGISSTPVITRKSIESATLYVVSAVEPRDLDFHTYLHALDVATGNPVVSPKEIAPTGNHRDGTRLSFSSQNQYNRAGIAYSNGSIYVGIGAHCDNDGIHVSGWLLRYSESLDLMTSFHTISSPMALGLAGIWMTGFAPAIDDTGNVFVVTGNGDFNPPYDYGQSVLKLDGKSFEVLDYFTPSNYPVLNDNDYDLGSGGIVLLPAGAVESKKELAAVIGKDPILYLLNRVNLGKEQPSDAGALQALRFRPPCNCGVWGGPAEYQSKDGLVLFVQTDHDVLHSYVLKDGGVPSIASSSLQGSTKGGYGGSSPIVTSNGSLDAIVWLLRRSDPIELEAYDATTLGSPLCSAYVGKWSNPTIGNSFLTPMIANGHVYAAAFNVVKIFGLADGAASETKACGE